MYVDKRSMKRHKAFKNIGKSIREHSRNETQTIIRTGKSDFLLRTRPRGSNTPWSDISPISITQSIPDFDIGIYNDVAQLINNPKMNEEEEPIVEDMEEIIADSNKRYITSDDLSNTKKKTPKSRSNMSTLDDGIDQEVSGEASGEDSDEENVN